MATKFKEGDIVEIKSLDFFELTQKNPYKDAGDQPDAAYDRISSVAGMATEVLALHPAGFMKLGVDKGYHLWGNFTDKMVIPAYDTTMKLSHTPKEFPVQEAAIALMSGVLSNPEIALHKFPLSGGEAKNIVDNVMKLVRVLELELQ